MLNILIDITSDIDSQIANNKEGSSRVTLLEIESDSDIDFNESGLEDSLEVIEPLELDISNIGKGKGKALAL